MALKCTQQAKFQFSATEIRWGESGPVDITETWLASNERESQSQCGIGQDIIWICKFLLQWDDLKPFLLNSWCLNWLNDWCLVLGNSLSKSLPSVSNGPSCPISVKVICSAVQQRVHAKYYIHSCLRVIRGNDHAANRENQRLAYLVGFTRDLSALFRVFRDQRF